jgi:hypothetical protein
MVKASVRLASVTAGGANSARSPAAKTTVRARGETVGAMDALGKPLADPATRGDDDAEATAEMDAVNPPVCVLEGDVGRDADVLAVNDAS